MKFSRKLYQTKLNDIHLDNDIKRVHTLIKRELYQQYKNGSTSRKQLCDSPLQKIHMNIQEIWKKKQNTICITDKHISQKTSRRKQSQLYKEYM